MNNPFGWTSKRYEDMTKEELEYFISRHPTISYNSDDMKQGILQRLKECLAKLKEQEHP